MATPRSDLREVFDKYSTIQDSSGELYITTEVFIMKFVNTTQQEETNRKITSSEDSGNLEQGHFVSLFCNIISRSKPGLITFTEFEEFEQLLNQPDALYKIMFELFNLRRTGLISLQDFEQVLNQTENRIQVRNLIQGSNVIKLYFGSSTSSSKSLNYSEFCQFVHDFTQEFMQRLFIENDRQNSGFIAMKKFIDIEKSYKSHLIGPMIVEKYLGQLSTNHSTQNDPKTSDALIPYSFYSIFNQLVSHLNEIKHLYLQQSGGSKTKELTKQDMLTALNLNKPYNSRLDITPGELDVLIELINLIKDPEERKRSGNDTITYEDLLRISPDSSKKLLSKCERVRRNQIHIPSDRGLLAQVEENVYRFFLGGLAGATGAMIVYPVDLIKTRMQNQRIYQSTLLDSKAHSTNLLYKNSFDCFRKILRNEGVRGVYRGMGLQLIGVAPEKAIKLAINDFLREQFTNKTDCSIPIGLEMVAGGIAGLAQVLVTNPLEIVKIRLQTAGEMSSLKSSTIPKQTAIQIIKELGFKGLYKGSRACMLRDSLFTSIYFASYAHAKEMLEDDEGVNSPRTLLISGICSAVPASTIATPIDVIKTRLQVVPRLGQTVYSGITDCMSKIYKEEGITAFFKGIIPRVVRSSPQFGITLFSYELFQRHLYIDFGGSPPKGSLSNNQIKELETQKYYKPAVVGDLGNVSGVRQSQQQRQLGATGISQDRIGGYKYAPQLFKDIQTKFGFKYLK